MEKNCKKKTVKCIMLIIWIALLVYSIYWEIGRKTCDGCKIYDYAIIVMVFIVVPVMLRFLYIVYKSIGDDK